MRCSATRWSGPAGWPWPGSRCASGSRWPRCAARDGVLVLETLLWPDEVRAADFPFLDEDIETGTQELKMASSLIDSMTEDFDPEQYHDSYREALEELVAAKVDGRGPGGARRAAGRRAGQPAGRAAGQPGRGQQGPHRPAAGKRPASANAGAETPTQLLRNASAQ